MSEERPTMGELDKGQGQQGSVLDLHVAEYEVLMTRNTYWITIQFSVAPAIAIYLTLLGTLWTAIKIVYPTTDMRAYQRTAMWIGLLGAQLFVLWGYQCVFEIYNNIRYVETKLRPELDKIVAPNPYWMYEHFLAAHRGFGYLFYESLAAVAVVLAIGVVSLRMPTWTKPDYGWLALNLGIAGAILSRNIVISKIRLSGFRT